MRGCEQLLYRAARLTDLARWEEVACLYVENGRLTRPSDLQNPIVGRAAILAALRARPPRITCHLLSNIVVEPTSATTAHVSSTVVLFTGSSSTPPLPVVGQKTLVGHFEDELSLINGGWAFAVRQGSMLLEYSATPPVP